MRKASKILCLIGGILAIVLALVWLGLSIGYFAFGGIAAAVDAGTMSWADVPENIRQFMSDYATQHGISTFAGLATAFFGAAVLFVVMFMFSVASAVISFILSKKEKTGLPLPIVCVVLSWAGNVCSFVGGVLAIVNWAVFERKE